MKYNYEVQKKIAGKQKIQRIHNRPSCQKAWVRRSTRNPEFSQLFKNLSVFTLHNKNNNFLVSLQ